MNRSILTYTTVDKVLHRAKLKSSDVHSDSETATAIINECIADAEAEIDALTRHPDGWDESEEYYSSVQSVATDLAASYLFQQDIAAKAVGRASEEVLIDRASPLYNRAMQLLSKIPGARPLYLKATEESTE